MKTINLELGVSLDSQKVNLGLFVLVQKGTTAKLRQEISSIKKKTNKYHVLCRE